MASLAYLTVAGPALNGRRREENGYERYMMNELSVENVKKHTAVSQELYQTISGPAADIWSDICGLELTHNIAELEVLGYTVIPPEKVAPASFHQALLNQVLDVVGRRTGVRPDIKRDEGESGGFSTNFQQLLLEDDLFVEAALNPVVEVMSKYMVGDHAVLSSLGALIKGRANDMELPLHVDETRTPAPFSPHPDVCNVTWILTDYSQENGSVCFVPGSHHYLRGPLPGEGDNERVAVKATAGSLIVWTGRTWHGAYARKAGGLRVNLLLPFFRPQLRTQDDLREQIDPEQLKRYPERLAKVLGMGIGYGWSGGARPYGPETFAMGRHRYD